MRCCAISRRVKKIKPCECGRNELNESESQNYVNIIGIENCVRIKMADTNQLNSMKLVSGREREREPIKEDVLKLT